MSKYFNYFPKTVYSLDSTNNVDAVTSIVSRFSFENSFKDNTSVYYEYNIQDSDTPEIIASKFYGDPEKHWVVFMLNNIIDPQFDWPLDSKTIIEFIDKKYTANGAANTTPVNGLAWALNISNVHSYYKVITTTGNDGTISIQKFQIDSNTYANTASTTSTYTTDAGETVIIQTTKETKSYYDYEIEQNESKREIKLLKREFVPDVEKEFKRIIKL